MTRDHLIHPLPGVVVAVVGHEAVLWSERDGVYYGLDEVAARVWSLSGAGHSLGTVHRVLLEDYDVDESRLWADLERLSSELVSLGLASTSLPTLTERLP